MHNKCLGYKDPSDPLCFNITDKEQIILQDLYNRILDYNNNIFQLK